MAATFASSVKAVATEVLGCQLITLANSADQNFPINIQHETLKRAAATFASSAKAIATDADLRMCLWWSLCTLYLHACQVRVTVGHSGLCCLLVWCILSALRVDIATEPKSPNKTFKVSNCKEFTQGIAEHARAQSSVCRL